MRRAFKIFYIFFYCSIALVIVLIAMGFEQRLFSEGQVIKTFKAGPVKNKRQVERVKTNFNWSQPGACKCSEGRGPCIQSFLDKNASKQNTKYPSMIEDYYIMNNQGSLYQGAGQVPWGIDVSSARIINIPFCGQERRAKESQK